VITRPHPVKSSSSKSRNASRPFPSGRKSAGRSSARCYASAAWDWHGVSSTTRARTWR
jgi:hypothetical protein